MSLGEDRVRTKFNPSSSSAVDLLKQQAAKFIDTCEELRRAEPTAPAGTVSPEVARCIALAQTYAETAAMYAVKAATAGK